MGTPDRATRFRRPQEMKEDEMAKRIYRYVPVGLDLWDRHAHQPEPGTLVRKCQPYGCPRNGTMGMCYVEDAQTGKFYGLVLLNSLTTK